MGFSKYGFHSLACFLFLFLYLFPSFLPHLLIWILLQQSAVPSPIIFYSIICRYEILGIYFILWVIIQGSLWFILVCLDDFLTSRRCRSNKSFRRNCFSFEFGPSAGQWSMVATLVLLAGSGAPQAPVSCGIVRKRHPVSVAEVCCAVASVD